MLTDVTAEVITVNHPGMAAQPAGQAQRLPVPTLAVPHQLPVHLPHFVGRAEQLSRLATIFDSANSLAPVVISAISGTAGIGKTALAVHWAHQIADQFPDGQLYVNLRGFDPAGSPMTSAEAIRGFLDAFAFPPEQIPTDFEAQTVLYRRLLAGRSILLVLDNARDSDQVRPLLPDTATCRVVITSRSQLPDLVTHHGARPITLNVLDTEDATALLAHRLGRDRVVAEADVLTELIDRCTRLPLALSIVAARAALNPELPLWMLVNELRDEQTRLDALDAGDNTSVRVAFSWSYQQLSRPAARMFRLLALHPGPDISVSATASMAGVEPRQARATLRELLRVHLVTQNSQGRFSFHDLLRAYATELTHVHDNDAERHTAQQRMLDHYLHTAHGAALSMYPRRQPFAPRQSPLDGVSVDRLVDYPEALRWFSAEHAAIMAVLRLAVAAGHDTYAWQLPHMLSEYLERHAHWQDWNTVQHLALTAAQHCGDLSGQAQALLRLARMVGWLFGNHRDAEDHLKRALKLFRAQSDQSGEADTHGEIAGSYVRQNRHAEALRSGKRALSLYRACGNRAGEAITLNSLGWYCAVLGDYPQAVSYGRQSLVLHRELGNLSGESATLDTLGYAFHYLGDYTLAIEYFQRAIALARELGHRYNEANRLDHLGDTYSSAGDLTAARDNWQQAFDILDALAIYRRPSLGYADADSIRTKLSATDQS
ncbi:tetratricopeptide repeat protein [Nocardia sp. NPDC050710]|uniref:ATP-binding protein n=1 Tax=Nocardia sp. NPDC050710 TaxID=3157220 RepID=UPI0034029188